MQAWVPRDKLALSRPSLWVRDPSSRRGRSMLCRPDRSLDTRRGSLPPYNQACALTTEARVLPWQARTGARIPCHESTNAGNSKVSPDGVGAASHIGRHDLGAVYCVFLDPLRRRTGPTFASVGPNAVM